METLFKEGTLNIFCDASISKKPDNTYYGCPAAIATMRRSQDQLSIIDRVYLLLDNTTNNDSEITAIQLAVELALKWRNKNMFNEINIFSDSNISVNGLNSWVYNWNKSKQDGVMYSSSGQEVANQLKFCTIIQTIIQNNLRVRIMHQRGHMNINKPDDLRKANLAIEANGIKVNSSELVALCNFNNYVDEFSRDTLLRNIDKCITTQVPIKYDLTDSELKSYKKLIER